MIQSRAEAKEVCEIMIGLSKTCVFGPAGAAAGPPPCIGDAETYTEMVVRV